MSQTDTQPVSRFMKGDRVYFIEDGQARIGRVFSAFYTTGYDQAPGEWKYELFQYTDEGYFAESDLFASWKEAAASPNYVESFISPAAGVEDFYTYA
jgi:hypothetical protein